MINSMKTLESYVGNTPLVKLRNLVKGSSNTVLAKLEGNNPAGSVKDRPALNMIKAAEERGEISPGTTLIEATSGNTGIALAMAAAIRGYPMVLIMPEHLSEERRVTMRAFGATILSVTREEGMEGARDLAIEMEKQEKGFSLISSPMLTTRMPTIKPPDRKSGVRPRAESPIL